MNRVTLIGRLTKDMEVRTSESGNTIGVFTIAVTRPYKKEDGQSESDFINCIKLLSFYHRINKKWRILKTFI